MNKNKSESEDDRFNSIELAELEAFGCSLKEANKYSPRFKYYDIIELFRTGCGPEEADKYNKRFDGWTIANLYNCLYWLKPEEINKEIDKYDKRFDGHDIVTLLKAGCSPKDANGYSPRFNTKIISILHNIGLTPDKITQDKQEILIGLFNEISISLSESHYYGLLGTGASGIVLLNKKQEFKRLREGVIKKIKEKTAWKFAKNICKEYLLLKKIYDYHKGKQKNITEIKGEPKGEIALKIGHIIGDSLENILKKHPSLPNNKILKYGSDIINGLIEMRQAGIWYHRDIRPANIIIDEKNDKAVIIDLGIATTDRHALPKDNRRYGGINDLVSLGQVMYKMATGKHLFVKSKSMEKTIHAQKIKDYRDKVYSDETGKLLASHITQVDKTVQDEQLKTLIKTCLTAKNYHYKKIQRMFKKFS